EGLLPELPRGAPVSGRRYQPLHSALLQAGPSEPPFRLPLESHIVHFTPMKCSRQSLRRCDPGSGFR
ncbi:MAG: hypothetical protein AB8B91_05495, partial [Rubripirellula sp.]